ncbi:DNA-directed RNA polymerases I and III subunit RPAC1 [Orussus abietinus]|uniref:DNA-directed RNA polymerases I and III subunit RPAC1 n=1 Tax=Orussus abietinus TaxID=222816 RepID=UPI0006252288|nr:DNA-directed RNA polymerases I and III subunit RPAC1 [Orussus abietinus]
MQSRKPRVILEEYGIPNAAEYSNLQAEGGWSIEHFKKSLKVEIVRESDDKREMEFDLIGVSAALANVFRRILLSEVPSMALEKVFLLNNTSLIADEILAHRLGLIPLKADPRLFEYCCNVGSEEEVSDQDTLRYEMKVTCTWNTQAPKDSRRPEDIYRNNNVYSRDIKWVPIGRQAEIYPNGEEQFGVLENDILICKMRPGQEIHAFMHAVKGIGKDHAKFSPVATATYRLMPDIRLTKPVKGEKAERLKNCFSPGVVEIVETRKGNSDSREARIKQPRHDSCSRNVFRYDDLKDCVQLGRIPDHFIYTIESVGALPAGILFLEAVKVLKRKCKAFIEEIDSID